VTFEGMRREGLDTLRSCLGRPMSKNSVLGCFSERRLADIQIYSVDSCLKVRMFSEKSGAEKEMKS